MSHSDAYKFVAGDEDLQLHEMFGFANTVETAATDLPPPANTLLVAPLLGSPFAGPLEVLQDQPVGWLSPSATGPVDGLDVFNFNDFLALDEGTDDVPAATEEAPSSPPPPPPPELADSSTRHEEPAAAPEQAEDLPAVAQLEAVQVEIAQLKAALAAESPQHKLLATPGSRQSSSSPRKRKSTGGEVSPPKKQATTQMGPIEALWSPKFTEDERRAFRGNLASPTTPKPSQTHLDSTPLPSTPYISSPQDLKISAEDLHSIQTFLHDNPVLSHSTTHLVDLSASPSNITMAHTVNMKVKRVPLKHAPRRTPKITNNITTKVTKKPKTTPKKMQHQRTASTTSTAVPSPTPPNRYRSIDELLAANFYSLNEQEKTRVLLPMLRNLDPMRLGASLAELPCIQAKGLGHEVRVARAIHGSPPTPEADDILATKLTTGSPLSPTQAAKTSTTPSPDPALQASPLSHKVAKVEVSEDHGAVRQREALEKAALLQAQGKKW
ncbi:hypothetical protein BU25DRAFT_456190 [Macroventuria anomochaeta]|uniref:Uncharacterized protein n=1 Tax=Macroventuria anomochaeta TaxID=301207 RepID=A0ACB6S910_9PLEO|nr:uncharacterized protein BU25DRAFT_456190 [Macroventuria anomochaeta]KAF2630463.1 hypothetical protein BU25DRAFT_456190 [Macroventuria anomochaeta]